MRVLVVAASKYGSTAEIASAIRERLNTQGGDRREALSGGPRAVAGGTPERAGGLEHG